MKLLNINFFFFHFKIKTVILKNIFSKLTIFTNFCFFMFKNINFNNFIFNL